MRPCNYCIHPFAFDTVTPLAQAFVKDAGKSVGVYLKEAGDVKITEFKRVALG